MCTKSSSIIIIITSNGIALFYLWKFKAFDYWALLMFSSALWGIWSRVIDISSTASNTFTSNGALLGTSTRSTIWKVILGSWIYINFIVDIPALACLVLWTEKRSEYKEYKEWIQSCWSSVHLKMTICIVQLICSTKLFAWGSAYSICHFVLLTIHFLWWIPNPSQLYVYQSSHNESLNQTRNCPVQSWFWQIGRASM